MATFMFHVIYIVHFSAFNNFTVFYLVGFVGYKIWRGEFGFRPLEFCLDY